MTETLLDPHVIQRTEALAKANAVYRSRANLKREIFRGETTVTEVLADPPAYLNRMAIGELLRAQKLWGNTRSRKLLRQAEIRENRRVGELTERQRDLIAGLLP